jgi:hypothetical protein
MPSYMNRRWSARAVCSTPWARLTRVSDGKSGRDFADVLTAGPGLKGIFEAIDNRTDFKAYMQNYVVARGTIRGPRRDGPYEEGFVSRQITV